MLVDHPAAAVGRVVAPEGELTSRTPPTTMKGSRRTNQFESAMTNRVGSGSSAPRPANIEAKVGMTFHRMTAMTMPAIADDRDRVDHGALDLGLQLDVLLDVGREALEDGVEDTARLAGRDHVREQVVEDLGVLAHGVGEAGAALHVHAGLLEDLGEGLVLLLAAQDLEALHERQTGVDHDRELAGEDGEVLGGHAAAELRQGDLLALLLDRRDQDLVAPQQLAITASLLSATRSPETALPSRVLPFQTNAGTLSSRHRLAARRPHRRTASGLRGRRGRRRG